MKEKKQTKDWYIAATHYLTAGFAIPFVFGFVIGTPLAIVLGENNLWVGIIELILMPVIMWFGVIYSAKYIERTYIVRDSNKIVNLSVIYSIVVIVGLHAYGAFVAKVEYISVATAAVTMAVFYLASKKYIKNSE